MHFKLKDFISKQLIFKFLFWGVFLIICFTLHSKFNFNADEGIILNGAWNILNHRAIYKDFFEIIPPGSFYLILFTWKVCGVSYMAAKSLSIFIIFLSALGIFATAQKIKRTRVNYLLPLIFLAISYYPFTINHNYFNLLFLIWALYLLVRWINNKKYSTLIASAAINGVGILFLHQKGLALAAGAIAFLMFSGIKDRCKHIATYITLSLLPLLLMAILYGPKNIYYIFFKFPIIHYTEANQSNPLWLVLFIILYTALAYMVQNSRQKDKKIQALLIIQLFLSASTVVAPDRFHVALMSFPLLIIISIMIKGVMAQNNIKSLLSHWLLIGLFLTITISPFIYYPKGLLSFPSQNISKIQYIRNECLEGKYLYAGPFMPMFYFELKKLNATPFSVLLTTQNTPEQFEEALQDFIQHRPSCAILVQPMAFFRHNPNNILEKYIRDTYKLVFNDGEISLYKENTHAD